MKIGASQAAQFICAMLLVCSHPVAGEQSPYLAIGSARLPESDFGQISPAATVTGEEFQLYAGLFGRELDSGIFEIGLDYQYTRFEYAGIAGRDRDLHRLQIPLQFKWQGKHWHLEGFGSAGVSTSSNVFNRLFRDGSSDDLFFSGRLESRRPSKTNTWLFGLGYDRKFGEPTLYPVAGVEVSPREALVVRLAFPDSGFHYQVSDRQTLSGRIFPAGHQWHVVSEELDDDFTYELEALRVQLNWNYRLRRRLSMDLSLGYEFERSHGFTDDQGLIIHTDADNGAVIAIGFRTGAAIKPLTHGGHL